MRFGKKRVAAAALALVAAAACGGEAGNGAGGGVEATAPAGPAITVSPTLPADLPDSVGLAEAAAYAWQEFIALNWPAVNQQGQLGNRDSANTALTFGDTAYAGPLVWHTFRAKIEIFPAPGANPNGYTPDSAQSFGYDSLPRYAYQSPVAPYLPQDSTQVPWINLDENDEIGLDAMYAGAAANDTTFPRNLILFMAKANRAEYTYVARNQFFNAAIAKPAQQRSQAYVLAHSASPPAGSDSIASLPNGTIEVKAAWRRLSSTEATSGRFYTTTVRYYRPGASGGTAYQNATFGLIGLHIIRKTPNRPAFVFATFEQADNLLDSLGARVEDENGVVNPRYLSVPPFTPAITSRNAASTADSGYTLGNVQQLTPDSTGATGAVAGMRLYLINSPGTATPQGFTAVNRRVHSIPPEVVQANRTAHAAIAAYNGGAADSVWQYYKLVNVQYQPIAGKVAGMNYTGADSANFYQANAVLETNTNLQVFSGMFQPSFKQPPVDTTVYYFLAITDWCGANFVTNSGTLPGCSGNTQFFNVRAGGHTFNMGGCMGCHGNAQLAGSDFSFILGEINNKNPQLADPLNAAADTTKFFDIFRSIARPGTRAAPAVRPTR